MSRRFTDDAEDLLCFVSSLCHRRIFTDSELGAPTMCEICGLSRLPGGWLETAMQFLCNLAEFANDLAAEILIPGSRSVSA
jgi:hypothetical protein